jgi:hypothetical protein
MKIVVTDDRLLNLAYLAEKGMSLKVTSTHPYTLVGPPSTIPFNWNIPTFLTPHYVVLLFKDACILSLYTYISGMTMEWLKR